MFMNLLGQNPELGVTPTSGLYEVIGGMTSSWNQSHNVRAQPRPDQQERLYNSIRGAILGWHSDKRYYMDKNRAWPQSYDLLKRVFPEGPKIVLIVRDLRGVCLSLEKRWRASPEYHITANPAMDSIEQRVQFWMNEPMIAVNLQLLRDHARRGVLKDFFVLRYEDLTKSPQKVMKELYKYLGLEYFPHDFDNIRQLTHEHDPIHAPYGDHSISEGAIKPVDESWDRVLGPQVSNEIRKINDWYYQTFYGNKK